MRRRDQDHFSFQVCFNFDVCSHCFLSENGLYQYQFLYFVFLVVNDSNYFIIDEFSVVLDLQNDHSQYKIKLYFKGLNNLKNAIG